MLQSRITAWCAIVSYCAAAFACSKGSKGLQPEAPLAMADSARAHIRRINDAIRKGDSAAYMSAYPPDVVLVFDGAVFGGSRNQYAAAVGRETREGHTRDAQFSNERITVVGPRAAAASLDFVLTGDSAGRSTTTKGAWSGVLGIREGRTVILQQHLSHIPAPRP